MELKTFIYIVDDDPNSLEGTEIHLDSCFDNVIPCLSPSVFFEKFSTAEPCVVLTDMRMVEMTGLMLQRKINERDPEIPVIIFTGQADMHQAIKVLRGRQGAWDYLSKPLNPNEIIDIVSEAVQKAQATFPARQKRDDIRSRLGSLTENETVTFLKLHDSTSSPKDIAKELGVLPSSLYSTKSIVLGKLNIDKRDYRSILVTLSLMRGEII